MPGNRNRERETDELLRRFGGDISPEPPSDACLDGEVLAAWTERSLPMEQSAIVERHVSSCARCQAVLGAFARSATSPADSETTAHGRFHRLLPWALPLAAAATIVVAVWVAMPTRERDASTPPIPEGSQATLEAPVPNPAPAAPPVAPPAAETPASSRASTDAAGPAERTRQRDAETLSKDARAERRPDAGARLDAVQQKSIQERNRAQTSANAAAAPVPPSMAESVTVQSESSAVVARKLAPPEIASTTSANRWRISGPGRVEHSDDGGTRWTPVSLAAPDVLVAGHSPSSTVAWLVGRGGAVYVTSDARTFERVPLKDAVDLVAVVAADGREATVTAVDGRVFHTKDRGATWTQK